MQELFDPPSRRLDPALETALEPLHDITPSVSDFSRGNLGRWRTETFGPPLLKPAQTRFESISEFFGIQKIVRITRLEKVEKAVRSLIEVVLFGYHSSPQKLLKTFGPLTLSFGHGPQLMKTYYNLWNLVKTYTRY
ncbi:MAG TPA: hypothetical protein HPP75_02840 [Rhodospirillaceae bacterium]|nr:hypothetical protein [Rhodospirillaceae bacterium]